MKAKLLKKIRRAYCVNIDVVGINEVFTTYTIFNRYEPKCKFFLDRDEFFDHVLSEIYGVFQSYKIIKKHKKIMRQRKIKSNAINKGYSAKDIYWLGK